jgi:hypothetical protein
MSGEKTDYLSVKPKGNKIDKDKWHDKNIDALAIRVWNEKLEKIWNWYKLLLNNDKTYSLEYKWNVLDIKMKQVDWVVEVAFLMEWLIKVYKGTWFVFVHDDAWEIKWKPFESIINSASLFAVKKWIIRDDVKKIIDAEEFAKTRHYNYKAYNSPDKTQVDRLNNRSIRVFADFLNKFMK